MELMTGMCVRGLSDSANMLPEGAAKQTYLSVCCDSAVSAQPGSWKRKKQRKHLRDNVMIRGSRDAESGVTAGQ